MGNSLVLVTGATSGIGLALADRLAAAVEGRNWQSLVPGTPAMLTIGWRTWRPATSWRRSEPWIR